VELVKTGIVAVTGKLDLKLQFVLRHRLLAHGAGRADARTAQVRSGARAGSLPVCAVALACSRRRGSSGMMAPRLCTQGLREVRARCQESETSGASTSAHIGASRRILRPHGAQSNRGALRSGPGRIAYISGPWSDCPATERRRVSG
jgi:hypothetical protein